MHSPGGGVAGGSLLLEQLQERETHAAPLIVRQVRETLQAVHDGDEVVDGSSVVGDVVAEGGGRLVGETSAHIVEAADAQARLEVSGQPLRPPNRPPHGTASGMPRLVSPFVL